MRETARTANKKEGPLLWHNLCHQSGASLSKNTNLLQILGEANYEVAKFGAQRFRAEHAMRYNISRRDFH